MTTSLTRLALALPLSLAFAGCDASYSDLSTERSADMDAGVAVDAAPDQGVGGREDSGVTEDTGVGGVDAGANEDAATPPVDMGMPPTGAEISGMFGGRGGYASTGTATIRETADGLEVVLSDDFSVDPGPGLEVVVSSVDNVGSENGPDDAKLPEGAFVVGFLPSVEGGATFQIPSERLAALPENQFVFIWCQPFDIEFARAVLN